MQSLNELIAESVEKKDIKTLESLETDLSDVIQFTKKSVTNLIFYKQAVANRILVQQAITRILGKQ